ncbi:hypothetical protein LTR08_007647 [Meristemomyces frigidus]|nr:hypothetical protein LTR08_007647 [Meristemomyces frigidus]
MLSLLSVALMGILLAADSSSAINLDINSVDSVSNAAQGVASNIMTMYSNTSEIPGLFPTPYYFWEGGLAWDSMINYWALTGDATYNPLVGEALLYQRGPNDNFMPQNQTTTEGNDDQSYWALAAMTAAERGLPVPQSDSALAVTWAELAQNVFDSQTARWDEATCGGGLRWQIFTFNNGYNYKNSASNGNLVQLAARLALYTGNATYSDWAQKVTQWSLDVGLIANEDGVVFDGFDTTTNCSSPNHIQWTASAGTYLSGAAYASNKTSTTFWNGIGFALYTNANTTFAPNGTLTEVACQSKCNTDQLAFRAVLARALANMRDLTLDSPVTQEPGCSVNNTKPSPSCADVGTIHASIDAVLKTSAQGAAAQCSGGTDGSACGADWSAFTWDGTQGLGQSLSALEILLANLPAVQRRTAVSTSSVVTGTSSNGTATSSNGTATSSNTTATSSNGTATSGVSSSNTSSSASASTNVATGCSASTFALLAGMGFVVASFM